MLGVCSAVFLIFGQAKKYSLNLKLMQGEKENLVCRLDEEMKRRAEVELELEKLRKFTEIERASLNKGAAEGEKVRRISLNQLENGSLSSICKLRES